MTGFRLPDTNVYNSFANYGNPNDMSSLGTGMYGLDSSKFSGGNQGLQTNAISDFLKRYGIIGSTDNNGIKTDGWGGLALGGAQALGGAYLGMKQYGIARDTLENNKRQFELNYAANRANTNTQLEDRQRARVASNPNAYQSVGDYMNQNGIR